MNLMDVFVQQGIVGVVCPVAFAVLAVAGAFAGWARSKTAGYTCLAGAWLAAGVFMAVVSRQMLQCAHADEANMAAAISRFVANLSVMVFFLQPACLFSMLVVGALAALKFDRRHIAGEVLAIVTWGLLFLALRWYLQAIIDMFGK